jgi:hypothetical protein
MRQEVKQIVEKLADQPFFSFRKATVRHCLKLILPILGGHRRQLRGVSGRSKFGVWLFATLHNAVRDVR